MLSLLIKMLHITLAFSLLTSSVGVVINQHFCRDQLKQMSLFAAVKSCHEVEETGPACPFHQSSAAEEGLEQKDCCHDSSQYFKSSQEQQLELKELPVRHDALRGTFLLTRVADLRSTASLAAVPFYRPPPRFSDYSIHFQVFRL